MAKGCKPINKYQVSFKIKNVGKSTIIRKGNYKNLLDNNLTLNFGNISGFDIKLSRSIFPLTHSKKSLNELTLSFKQWMPHDFVEFVIER